LVASSRAAHRQLPTSTAAWTQPPHVQKEIINVNTVLRRLYDACEEDMRFGIGTIRLGTDPPMPIICVVFRDWSRAQLEIVRDTFQAGINLTHLETGGGVHQLRLATREIVSIEHTDGGDTSVLRAPAWDAQLAGIDGKAFCLFDEERQRQRGFLLLTQTDTWEFLTALDEARDRAVVGVIRPVQDLTGGPSVVGQEGETRP